MKELIAISKSISQSLTPSTAKRVCKITVPFLCFFPYSSPGFLRSLCSCRHSFPTLLQIALIPWMRSSNQSRQCLDGDRSQGQMPLRVV